MISLLPLSLLYWLPSSVVLNPIDVCTDYHASAGLNPLIPHASVGLTPLIPMRLLVCFPWFLCVCWSASPDSPASAGLLPLVPLYLLV